MTKYEFLTKLVINFLEEDLDNKMAILSPKPVMLQATSNRDATVYHDNKRILHFLFDDNFGRNKETILKLRNIINLDTLITFEVHHSYYLIDIFQYWNDQIKIVHIK